MKLYLLFFCILFSCISNSDKKISETNIKKDTINHKFELLENKKSTYEKIEKCDCKDYKKFNEYNNFNTDLSFSNFQSNVNDSIFELFTSDSLIKSIKSIKFDYFDTIPEKYSIFKNVEYIVIVNQKSINGINNYPNLKHLILWGSQININPTENWLKKIEEIHAEKSTIKGLKTFSITPNLKEIYFAHSKLEPFPEEFDKLKCLRNITLGAHRGNIDLSKIDLSYNPCLINVNFSTWYDAFSGIPKGLDPNRTFTININHQKLTKEEKEVLSKFNNKNK